MATFHPHDHDILPLIFFSSEKRRGENILVLPEANNAADLDLGDVAGVIACGKSRPLPGFKSHRFHFVNNPDGSIRWLLPSGCRRPVFLKLYNGSSWRGRLFRLFFQATFALGLKGVSTAGSLTVFTRGKLTFSRQDFAIFTGTVGENRKAVFAQKREEGKDWFFKLPLTPQAEKLTNREAAALHELGDLNFEKLEVPQAEKEGHGVWVSSVRPKNPTNNFYLQTTHFQALEELSGYTKLYLPLESLAVWSEIEANLKTLSNAEIKNDLPPALIQKTLAGLKKINTRFDSTAKLPTAISHGDFTPWNMFLSAKKLHLYDWELSARLPLLFDVFHFIFQAGILVERAPFSVISERVEALKSEPFVRQILGGDEAVFEQLFHFYLLRNVSYYLTRYLGQNPLHEQAHWLLGVWSEAVEVAAAGVSVPQFSK